jgi:hypothetical protein
MEIDNQIANEIKTGIIAAPQGETLDKYEDGDTDINNTGE